MRFALGPVADAVTRRMDQLGRDDVPARIRRRDPTVWSPNPATPELANRLGWLDLPDTMRPRVDEVVAVAEELKDSTDRIVLCGMGGSSLAPEVLWRVLGDRDGYPALHLLDSTHPAAVAAAMERPSRSVYLIASKSGTTLETRCFQRACWEAAGHDGSRFVAVTDPETALAEDAIASGYHHVFINPPDIGGRFSALSLFGLVPAALLGADVRRLLARAGKVAESSDDYVRLGVAMAVAALGGRDKLTLFLSPALEVLGLWLEQLIAESTGKQGTGILPVVGEMPGEVHSTAADRLYVQIRLDGDGDEPDAVTDLAEAGQPVVEVRLADTAAIAEAFYGWELATAVAGHVLGVNPFDQPNVAESKKHTARVLARGGSGVPLADEGALEGWAGGIQPGDYAALMAYLPPGEELDARLRRVQTAVREQTGVPVTVGYGPRFLHSTGQLHKGGPPKGHFLQIVDDAGPDIPVPGESYGFRQLIDAQADGDLEALQARRRPILRVRGLEPLEQVFGA